jgi:type III secretion system FlhB-like substrate exporter
MRRLAAPEDDAGGSEATSSKESRRLARAASGAIRQRQRQIAMGGVAQAMREAQFVVTNPTHFSVAVAYDPAKAPAPVVLAKGRGEKALAMRELAAELNGLPVLEFPALARSVYFTTRERQMIREELYGAVACGAGLRPSRSSAASRSQRPDDRGAGDGALRRGGQARCERAVRFRCEIRGRAHVKTATGRCRLPQCGWNQIQALTSAIRRRSRIHEHDFLHRHRDSIAGHGAGRRQRHRHGCAGDQHGQRAVRRLKHRPADQQGRYARPADFGGVRPQDRCC